jgi:hypothetical protein
MCSAADTTQPATAKPTTTQVLDALAELTRNRAHHHTPGCACHRCPALRRILLDAGEHRRLYEPELAR